MVEGLDSCGLAGVAAERRVWLSIPPGALPDPDSITLVPERTALFLAGASTREDDLARIAALRRRGYQIAIEAPDARGALLEHVDAVRWDIGAASESLRQEIDRVRASGALVIAGGVETREQHKLAKELGADLCQGSFFCEPEAVGADGPAPSKVATLKVLAALQQPDIEFSELDELINRDAVLCYRLLRYINSAFFGLRRPVDSVAQVVVLLGLSNLRRWVTMTALAGVDARPAELLVTGLARARFCELGGAGRGQPDQLFTLGLFSVLDALMEAKMSDVLRSIPLSEDMKRALIAHQGPMGQLLDIAVACEHGATPLGPSQAERRRLAGAYAEALAWASAAFDEVSAEP